MKRAALLALAVVLAGCGSRNETNDAAPGTATLTSTTAAKDAPLAVTEQTVCPSEQTAGIVAVFGHRKSTAAAQKLAASAAAVGFQGLVVQRRGCDDYAVVLPGLRNMRQAAEFRREARGAKFDVTIECRSHSVEGGLAAVFGHRKTRRAALRLRAAAERVGFQGLEVQQDRCHDWEVDLYGLKTVEQRRQFRAEARRAGFRVVFELG